MGSALFDVGTSREQAYGAYSSMNFSLGGHQTVVLCVMDVCIARSIVIKSDRYEQPGNG